MSNQTWLIQISHVCHTKYKPIKYSHVYVINLVACCGILIWGNFQNDINITLILIIVLLSSFVIQCHYIYCIIDEITNILGIRCFITKQTTQRRMIA
jgi:hypothetical protein